MYAKRPDIHELESTETQKLLAKGLIRPSTSVWRANYKEEKWQA